MPNSGEISNNETFLGSASASFNNLLPALSKAIATTMAGRLGAPELAATGLISTLELCVTAIGYAPLYGIKVKAGELIGAQRDENSNNNDAITDKEIGNVYHQGLKLGLCTWVIATAFSIPLMKESFIESTLGQDPEVSALLAQYFRWLPATLFFNNWFSAGANFGIEVQKEKRIAAINLPGSLATIGISAACFYYFKTGLIGLAYAKLAQAFIATALLLFDFSKHEGYKKYQLNLSWKKIKEKSKVFKELAKTGALLMINFQSEIAFFVVCGIYAGKLGNASLYAFSASFLYQIFLNAIIYGMAAVILAASTRAFHANEYKQVNNILKDGLKYGILLNILCYILLFFFKDQYIEWLGSLHHKKNVEGEQLAKDVALYFSTTPVLDMIGLFFSSSLYSMECSTFPTVNALIALSILGSLSVYLSTSVFSLGLLGIAYSTMGAYAERAIATGIQYCREFKNAAGKFPWSGFSKNWACLYQAEPEVVAKLMGGENQGRQYYTFENKMFTEQSSAFGA